FVRISTAHHKNPDRRLAIYPIVDPLQPMIEPAQLKLVEIDRCLGSELRFAGVAASSSSMRPRPHDQPLHTLLVLAQRDVIEVRHLRPPRVIPSTKVVHRNVLILGYMLDYARASIFPEAVIISMRHGFHHPALILGREPHRRCPPPKRQAFRVFPHLLAQFEQRFASLRITGPVASAWATNIEDPVHPAHFKRAIVPHAITSEIPHC